jgi:hypothetical protein
MQSASGLVLSLFMWDDMLAVSSIIYPKEKSMNAGTSRRRMVALVTALGVPHDLRQRAGAGADRLQVQPRRRQRRPRARPQVLRQASGRLKKGQVKIDVYANSTLYKDKEEMGAQLGAVQV